MIAAAPSELLIDEYELAMADSYLAQGKDSMPVAFELFARELPPHRGYLVAAGLERAVEVLTGLRFGEEALGLPASGPGSLAGAARAAARPSSSRATWTAVPEGTVVHAREPILRVEGDLLTCQLAETLLLNQVNFQTMIATKASRIVAAAAGRPVVDFGFRRAHGADAGHPRGPRGLHRRLHGDRDGRGRVSVGRARPPGRWRTATCSRSRPTSRRSARSCTTIPTARRS